MKRYNIMNKFHPLRTLPLVTLLLSLPALADEKNDELEISPRLFVDGVAYRDTDGGHGSDDIQNTNGIFNVHSHATGGHNHGGSLRNGLNFRSAELSLHGRYGGWLEGRFNYATDGRNGALEELWLKGTHAASGLSIKGGKFLSDIGWQNRLHPHAWDFVDQALPYQMLFAGGLSGNGAQVNWSLPAQGFGLTLGTEALTSGNEAVAATLGPVSDYHTTSGKTVSIPFKEKGAWPSIWTGFAKASIPIADQHQFFVGASYVHGRLHQELHTYHPGINDADHALQGDTDTFGASLAYHYQAHGQEGAGDLRVEAEYFYQRKDLLLNYHETKPWNIGQPRVLNVDSYYVQALYGLAPRWTVGLRYDVAGNIQEALRSGSPLHCSPPYQSKPCPRQDSQFDGLSRLSAVLSWQIDDRQKLRLQLSKARVPVAEDINGDGRSDAIRKNFTQAFLQYQVAFGAPVLHTRHALME